MSEYSQETALQGLLAGSVATTAAPQPPLLHHVAKSVLSQWAGALAPTFQSMLARHLWESDVYSAVQSIWK